MIIFFKDFLRARNYIKISKIKLRILAILEGFGGLFGA
jgi:hypothetical protein